MNVEEFGRKILAAIRPDCVRIDARNHFLLYNKKKASPELLELIAIKENQKIKIVYVTINGVSSVELISEEEWGNRNLGETEAMDVPPEYFDEDYFRQGNKSCFSYDYTWENSKPGAIVDAQVIEERFRPKTVLDCGCARGFLCKALMMRGIDAWGFDISKWAVDNCEPEVKGRLIQFVMDGKTPWPYKDNQFDIITAYSVLEHIDMKDIPFIMKEMARVSSKWVYMVNPVSITEKNEPWGDPTHKTIMPLAWWLNEGLKVGLLFNWQQTSYDVTGANDGHPIAVPVAQVYIAFQKERLELVTQRRTIKEVSG